MCIYCFIHIDRTSVVCWSCYQTTVTNSPSLHAHYRGVQWESRFKVISVGVQWMTSVWKKNISLKKRFVEIKWRHLSGLSRVTATSHWSLVQLCKHSFTIVMKMIIRSVKVYHYKSFSTFTMKKCTVAAVSSLLQHPALWSCQQAVHTADLSSDVDVWLIVLAERILCFFYTREE